MLFLDHESDSFGGFMVKIALVFKSQGIEKIDLFSQGTENCQNLRHESLIIVNPKYIEIFSLSVLNVE